MDRPRWGVALLVLALLEGAAAAQGDPDPETRAAALAQTAQPPVEEEPPWAEGETLDRQALIAAVLARNPSLEAARQAWRAARQRIPQAVSLSDPMAVYSLAPASVGSDEVRFGQIARFAQALPFPGTLRLRGQAARAEAEAAQGRYESSRLRLATAVSLLYDDYYLVHRALEVNADHQRLLEDFQRIAVARYAAGLAAQQDPIQAEVEGTRLLHREVVLEARRKVLVAGLNALLHRAPEVSLPPPPAALPLPAALPGSAASLVVEALASRPELAAQEAEVRAREKGVDLARLEFFPDFEASAAFNSMWNQTDHRWMLGVGVKLPVFRKRLRAAVAEAAASLEIARNERRSLEDAIAAEVAAAHAGLTAAYHVVELYRSRLLPASRDQVEAARAGFESGRNSFLVLIEAERNQRSVELGYHEALAGYYRARAELDRAMGQLPQIAPATSEPASSHSHNVDPAVQGVSP